MIKLDTVAAFAAIAASASFTDAARQLALSKSVVSERLTELERMLGAKLVQRTTRRVSLTEDGIAFYERAKRILRIALLATFLLEVPLRDRTLKVIDVGAEAEGAMIYLGYPEHLRSSAKIRALTAWLQESFAHPAWDRPR